MPRSRRFDQELTRKLLTEAEQTDHFIETDVAGLLEGDLETQANYMAQARQWGWQSVNEIRHKLNLNGIGPEGDIYLQPGNMVEAGDEPDTDDPPPNETEGDDNDDQIARLTETVEALGERLAMMETEQRKADFLAVAQRFIAKEQIEVERASTRGGNFLEWLDRFHDRHRSKFEAALRSAGYPTESVAPSLRASKKQIVSATEVPADQLPESIKGVTSNWETRAIELWEQINAD